MMLFMAEISQPYISIYVHQCKKYLQNPHRNHELAVKRIVHYLIGRKDNSPI